MVETLKGIKVVAFTRAAAGCCCVKMLTEFGADTVFVEPVKGIPLRYLNFGDFYINNQKSVPINMRDPKGVEFMHRLLEKADVFVSNYRNGVLKTLGLDYESLKDKYPKLIHATISGYGTKGPMKDAPGFDVTAFWGRAGLSSDSMDKNANMPLIVPQGTGDVACGENLAMGVIAALFDRTRTGKGMQVYTSLYSVGLFLNNSQIIDQQLGVKYPKTRKDPGRAMKNTFRCKDGWVQTMTLNFDKDFNSILKVAHLDNLIGDPRWKCMEDTEGENAIELTEILDSGFAQITVQEAVDGLTAADVAVSKYFTGLDTVTDEQAEANTYFSDVDTLKGKRIRIPANPIKFNGDETLDEYRAPQLGEHTVEVMKEYGYSDAEIDEYIKNGTVVAQGR
ncbi:MAG: CoA transferase [Lachnospiraceae bacterium]|nr:CoA transferase [Lachnospiraceae bacterium]